MSSFYVTLPSTSIKDSGGAEYRTMLQHELILPEDDWHVALSNFQYIGQKWGSLTFNEHIIGIQYFGPVTKKFVMDWSAVGEYKVHVNGSESEIQKMNYTWEELQTQIKNVFNLTLAAQNEVRKKQKKPKITAELLFLTSGIMVIKKDRVNLMLPFFHP